MLGLLRGDGPAPLDPGRGLAALPQLVEEVRRSGARVDLADRIDSPPSVPLQLALYRVVQESLTNARRHAPGAAISPFPFFLLVPLFWLVVIVVVALLVRRGARRRWEAAGGPPFGPNRSPEQMLSARFANGEIDEVEYGSRLAARGSRCWARTDRPAAEARALRIRRAAVSAGRGGDQVAGRAHLRTHSCITIAAAAAALIERVEPYCGISTTAAAPAIASGLRPGPS